MFYHGGMPERKSEMLTNRFLDAGGTGGGGTADPDPNTDPNNDPNTQTTPSPEETFESWLEALPDETKTKAKALYETNVSGLKTALQSEREAKKELSAQLKELLPKVEKGSELEKQLTEMADKAETAERRAQFADEAIKPEIGCRNIKAAYALAVAEKFFDKRGNPEWERIKAAAPELFGTVIANANPGNGTRTTPAAGNNMNAFIRGAAGRQ